MLDTLAGNINRSVDRVTPTGIGWQETSSSHFQHSPMNGRQFNKYSEQIRVGGGGRVEGIW